MDVSFLEGFSLIIGGVGAGIINTLAGNGSAITLTLLMAMGLDANMANATNRVGAALQTLTSVLSLRRTPRTYKNIRDAFFFVIPSVIGSVIGAYVAVETPPMILKYIIGGVMVFLLFTLIKNPGKWLIGTDTSRSHKTRKNWIWFFLVGLYAGFIQMGIGVIMLAILVLIAKYSLRDGNIIKLFIAFFMTVPAFIVFALSGDIVWLPGVLLAIGAMIGAWIGARFLLYHSKANQITRWILIGIIIVAIIRIFGPLFIS